MPAIKAPTVCSLSMLLSLVACSSQVAGQTAQESSSSASILESTRQVESPKTRVVDLKVPTGELVRQRYPNGQVKIERWVVETTAGDFQNHGTYAEFDSQGTIVVSGRYEHGKRSGEWRRQLDATQVAALAGIPTDGFHPPFLSKVSYRGGVMQGHWTCVDSEGKLLFSWKLDDGVREGESNWFNGEGNLVQTVPYRQNVAHGLGRVARSSESGSHSIEFIDGKLKKRVDDWFPAKGSAGRQLKAQSFYLVATPFNIQSQSWDESRIEYRPVEETPRVRHGMSVTFFPNGQRETEGHYDHGKRVGTFAWWYPNGQQRTVGEYQRDLEEGRWSWWHANGMKEATGEYVAGQKINQWSQWNADGQLVQRATLSKERVAVRPNTADSVDK